MQSDTHKLFHKFMDNIQDTDFEGDHFSETSSTSDIEWDDGVGVSDQESSLESESEMEELDFEISYVNSLLDEEKAEDDYFPFPNKIFALLYCILHSPRPMGESNLKFIWFVLHQTGHIIPSISEIKKFKLPDLCPPNRYVTEKGVPFYINSISSIVQRFIGNPQTASSVHRFPVLPNGPYKEFFHARRWHQDSRFFTPMIQLNSGKHVYIRDCVRCLHPVLQDVVALVIRFFEKEDEELLYADIDILLTLDQFRMVVPNTEARYLHHGTLILFESISLSVSNIVDLCPAPYSLLRWEALEQTLLTVTAQDFANYIAPHPFRERACGQPVVILPIVLFSDDTSGNKSKKWHKFDSWSIIFAGLPKKQNAELFNIHFCCCSDSVTALEMSKPLSQELIKLETQGVEAYDAFLNQNVVVKVPLLCIIGDNPRSSELLNHLGSSARKYCRICMVDKEINPSSVDQLRTADFMTEIIEKIRMEPSQKRKAEMRTEYGLREDYNPMLSIPADLFQSTPVECLHTILLGPYKYLLKKIIPLLSPQQKEEVLARIREFNYSGFDCKLMGNVVRYYQSFVGRDYKAWAQMALSILYPYLNDGDKEITVALSKVFKICYCNQYDPSRKHEWDDICKEFVAIVARCRPDMLIKQKIHLVLHLVDCMEEFGPTSCFSSERFEAFNSFIRAQNIYGNKHAPSRDICKHFAEIEHLRYICEGGYFSTHRRSCGPALRVLFGLPMLQSFINNVPMQQSLRVKEIYQPSTMRKIIDKKPLQFSSLLLDIPEQDSQVQLGEVSKIQHAFNVHHPGISDTEEVWQYRCLIGQNGKMIYCGDFIKLSLDYLEMSYGRLLCCAKMRNGRKLCILRGLQMVLSLEGVPVKNEMDCPLMILSDTIFTVESSFIMKAVSINHECGNSCKFSIQTNKATIEREECLSSKLCFQHDWCGNNMYHLNIYCMN